MQNIKYYCAFLSIWALLGAFAVSCSERKKEKPPLQALVEVNVLEVKKQDVPVDFEFVAQTQSSHLVNIQARVSGFLEKKAYTEGAFVQKGQVLFIMDKKPFEVQVEAAKAALDRQQASFENAKLNLNRVEPLAKLNALSQKDLDDAKGNYLSSAASVEQAKAQLETALLNLSYCTITSPIDGITSSAYRQEGTYLSVQDSLLTTVSALSPMWVNFSLSEKQIQNFKDQVQRGLLLVPKDEEFVVEIIQVNGETFPYQGKITFKEPYFNAQTGTFLIRASVDNPHGVLRSNQYVRAKVVGSVRPNAVLIPQRAVQQSNKGHYVWVVDENNKVDLRPVIVGDWQGVNWFISEGLQQDDKVVVDGSLTLQAGALVNIKRFIDKEALLEKGEKARNF